MIRKYLILSVILLVILSFLGSGINCRRHRAEEETTPKEIAQKEPERDEMEGPIDKLRRKVEERKVVGRGLAKREHERRRGGGGYDPVELSDDEKEAIEMETVVASFMPLKSHLQAMGKVLAHPLRKAIVSYAFPARISQIHVRIGDWVKARQRLVTLQSEEVGTAKSEFYKAQADYELAKVNFEREKRLFDRGVGAKKNFLAAESEFKVAQASLNAAEKKLHVLGFTEEQVKIISETHQINPVITLFAPISGKIIDNKAILGAMIDQETEILTIMDPTVLCIDAEIYEKDIAKIRIGQEVEISVPAYPGDTFIGKIRYISDVLHEETRTITVRTEVDNKDYKLSIFFKSWKQGLAKKVMLKF